MHLYAPRLWVLPQGPAWRGLQRSRPRPKLPPASPLPKSHVCSWHWHCWWHSGVTSVLLSTHCLSWRVPWCWERLSAGGERATDEWLDSITDSMDMSWGFPDSSAGKASACSAGDPSSIPGSGRSAGERLGDPFQYSLDFPGGSDSEECACNVGDLGSIPELGIPEFPGEGNGYPLQYSGLENLMDRGAWQASVHWDGKESDRTEQLWLSLLSKLQEIVKEKQACSQVHGVTKSWTQHSNWTTTTSETVLNWSFPHICSFNIHL